MGKLQAIITVGISGSGKTTFAEKKCEDRSWVNVNRDDLRRTITASSYERHNRAVEKMVTPVQKALIEQARAQGKCVIISDTNLNPNLRKSWRDFLEGLDYKVTEQAFPIDLRTAIKRDMHRKYSAGIEAIHQQWKLWLEYINFKTYEPNDSLPEAIIFDVDGTLAHRHSRGPFELHKVSEDYPIQSVVDMLKGYSLQGYQIIVLSGRDGVCYNDTVQWLDDHVGVEWDIFHMRREGDNRPDTEVKSEMFWDVVAPNYNVVAVVDDRPKVCQMWRDLGLKVIQVADPHFDF